MCYCLELTSMWYNTLQRKSTEIEECRYFKEKYGHRNYKENRRKTEQKKKENRTERK